MKAFMSSFFVLLSLVGYGQCEDLTKKVDKFDGSIVIHTPSIRGNFLEPVVFTRSDQANVKTIYLRLTAKAQLSAPKKGVFILFKDGSKLEWPDEEVEFDYSSSKGYYSKCFIELTTENLAELKTKEVIDIKLYIYQRKLDPKDSKRARQLSECISEINPADIKSE